MIPKEKAKELFNKFYDAIPSNDMGLNDDALEKCALIAVDEIMNALPPFTYGLEFVAKIDYWEEVKQEINNL